jgi:ATP-dependent Lon protease
MKIHLMTGADSNEHEVELSGKYQEIKKNLEQDRIALTYDFDWDQHDRSIETNTGWRITLGRGLDIFKKPEGKFTLGFVDQTKRECKATTINYTKVN